MPHVAFAIACNIHGRWRATFAAPCVLLVIGAGSRCCFGDDPHHVTPTALNYELVGEVSPDFRNKVHQAWESLPPAIGSRMLQRGWRIKLAAFVVDAVPELDGVQPRGWPAGWTWNNTDAVHLSDRRILVLAEKRRTPNGQVLANNRIAGVLGHEVGHAFDLTCYPQVRISSTARFRQAYLHDVKILSTQSTASLAYYLQGTNVGRQETFAEAFALITGRGSDIHQRETFEKAFPTVMQTTRSIIADYDE